MAIEPTVVLDNRFDLLGTSILHIDGLTLFGLFAVTAMLVCYALEERSAWFILAFAVSCVLGSIYGFLQGAWPFGLIEAIWAAVAVRRWWKTATLAATSGRLLAAPRPCQSAKPRNTMTSFRTESGDWTRFRALKPREFDLHRCEWGRREVPYWVAMQEVRDDTLAELVAAQKSGAEWLLIRHGGSTSGPGKTTARSVVRRIMRSSSATPFIVRRDCVQHEMVFLARIQLR